MESFSLRDVPDVVVERFAAGASVSAVAVRELADVFRRVDDATLLGDAVVRRFLAEERCQVPHLIDPEVASVLGRRAVNGALDAGAGDRLHRHRPPRAQLTDPPGRCRDVTHRRGRGPGRHTGAVDDPRWTAAPPCAAMRVLRGLVAVALLAGCTTTTPVGAPDAGGPPVGSVEGYVVAGDGADALVARDAVALDLLGVDGVLLTADGAGVSPSPDGLSDLTAHAHEQGLRTELLVSNYDESLGDFSPAIGAALLSSPAHRSAVAAELVERVVDGGFDGLQVDLESLTAEDAGGLVALVVELRAGLDEAAPASGPGLQLSVAVPASTEPDGYAGAGFAVDRLAAVVDRVVLMAYDQHGPTWSGPGPVGGSPWARACLDALLAAGVPAAQVDLGVAGYGYTWPEDGSDGSQVAVERARDLAGDRAVFDEVQGEWTAVLPDGTALWWSDARSLAQRAELAERAGAHGTALWELSTADPL